MVPAFLQTLHKYLQLLLIFIVAEIAMSYVIIGPIIPASHIILCMPWNII